MWWPDPCLRHAGSRSASLDILRNTPPFSSYLLQLAKAFSKPRTSLRWEILQVNKRNSTSESLLLWPKALQCLVVKLTSEASCIFVGTGPPEGGQECQRWWSETELERDDRKAMLEQQGGPHPTNGMNSWDRRIWGAPSAKTGQTTMVGWWKIGKDHTIYADTAKRGEELMVGLRWQLRQKNRRKWVYRQTRSLV